MKHTYKYFTKYLTVTELNTELEEFGGAGWKLVYIEHCHEWQQWFVILMKEL